MAHRFQPSISDSTGLKNPVGCRGAEQPQRVPRTGFGGAAGEQLSSVSGGVSPRL